MDTTHRAEDILLRGWKPIRHRDVEFALAQYTPPFNIHQTFRHFNDNVNVMKIKCPTNSFKTILNHYKYELLALELRNNQISRELKIWCDIFCNCRTEVETIRNCLLIGTLATQWRFIQTKHHVSAVRYAVFDTFKIQFPLVVHHIESFDYCLFICARRLFIWFCIVLLLLHFFFWIGIMSVINQRSTRKRTAVTYAVSSSESEEESSPKKKHK